MSSIPTGPISVEELYQASQKLGPKDLILDVRSNEEFAEGHVPGAKLIPVDEIETRSSELKGVENLYIYCRAGRRATMAFYVLRTQGLEKFGFKQVAVVDEGGMPDWTQAGYPVE